MEFFDAIPAAVNIIAFFLIYIFFSYSLGATLWLYIGEVAIEKIVGVSTTANLLSVCIIVFFFPITIDYIGVPYGFLFFGVCMVISAIYCHFDLVETKNKSKQEILAEVYY